MNNSKLTTKALLYLAVECYLERIDPKQFKYQLSYYDMWNLEVQYGTYRNKRIYGYKMK